MQWSGVFPALTTKFTNQDTLDIPMFVRNIDKQIEAGVHGIILGGTLGEASTLTRSEKETLVKTSLEKAGNKIPVILNIAEGSTNEAIRQVALAETWGVNGLMLLPPMRYGPDHRELVTYFRTVARSTKLPIMIYNNPVDYKTEVTLDAFDELQSETNIQAVKESTRDVSNVVRMKNRFGNRYSVLCGVDTLALESFCVGADGWVAGLVCAFPKETMALYNLAKAGSFSQALALYQWFLPLLELDIRPKLVQYIKLAEQSQGIGTEYVRAPRLTLEGEERQAVLQIIQRAVENRPAVT